MQIMSWGLRNVFRVTECDKDTVSQTRQVGELWGKRTSSAPLCPDMQRSVIHNQVMGRQTYTDESSVYAVLEIGHSGSDHIL